MEITVKHAAEAACQAKMYGRMYSELARLAEKMIEIYPALEAVRPMKSGMQALCGFHWSLDKAKSLLQYCADSSKLYLAITGDSIFSRFEKVKDGLEQNLRRLEQIVPRHLAQQIAPILTELEQTIYVRDPFEQEAGKELIALLQNSRDSPSEDVCSETSAFCEIACKLGMTSNDVILAEKKALRRLMEKAHNEEDRKKESLVSYLLRLLHRYSKIQRTDNLENETVEDGRDSFTLSLSERALEASASSGVSEGHNSEIYVEAFENESTNYKKTRSHSSLVPLPPEEFRCPISLQLMSDPVIISSGQTYERVCIEKWFEERHDTCPKTQQKLSHLGVTPNYCVKGLIASWCEKYGLTIPDPPSPLPSLVTDCRWDLQSDVGPPGDNIHLKGDPIHDKQLERHTISAHSKFSTELESLNGDGDCSVPSMYTKQSISDEDGDSCILSEGEPELDINLDDPMAGLAKLLAKLKLASLEIKCKAAERIRMLTKDNAEARSYIGDSGFIPVLVGFLQATMVAENVQAQETAALALLNIAINNNRNKAEIVAAGAVPLLVKLLASGSSLSAREAAVVVMLTISCLDENKPSIGSSGVIPYLVNHLNSGSNQGVKDALTSLFNLSIFAGNRPCIINGGVVQKLVHLLSFHDAEVTEKCISVLYNLASLEEGRASIAETEGCISALAEILDAGTHKEKELVVATFLLLCSNSVEHSQLVLREGIIPSLVKLSVTGNPRGKDKAQKLLQHFREQRQSSYMFEDSPSSEEALEIREKSRCQKIFSKKRFRKSFSFFSRSKSLGFYQC